MDTSWPFPDPPNRAIITLRSIVEGAPVLRVTHWHGWQFTGRDTPELRDAVPVGLAEMLALDSTLEEVADLPEGWQASRRHIGDAWMRAPHDHTTA